MSGPINLVALIGSALTIHEASFVPDAGCEVTGEFKVSIIDATKTACDRAGLFDFAAPLGVLLDLALDSADGVDELREQIREAL